MNTHVRRIPPTFGSDDPDSPAYNRLGYLDADGVYHFRDGQTLPTTGVALVVGEDGTPATMPNWDAADPEWSAAQRTHCVDATLQATYDRGE